MNILQINTVDREGGAAKIAYQIKQYLEDSGDKTNYLVKIKHSSESNTYLMPDDSLLQKISNNIKNVTKKDILSTLKNHAIKLTANDIQYFKSDAYTRSTPYKKADLVHLHNLHGNYFPLRSLVSVSKQKPVVWTLHDMWALTGHCSHSFDCNQWQSGCGNCPYLETYPAITWDNAKNLWNKKKWVYQNSKITIVSSSKWIADKVAISQLKDQAHRLIYNGVDTSVFKPQAKPNARKALNLPKDKLIVMFIAYGGSKSSWKGGKFLKEIQKRLSNDQRIHFLCVGGTKKDTKKSNEKITFVEKISDPNILAQYYNSADIFIFPSLAETFPLVILEAMACGLPIVSFDVGGVKEALIHKKHGYISKYKNSKDLIKGISFIRTRTSQQLDTMKSNAIKTVHQKFTIKQMLQSYKNLYQELILSYANK